MFKIPDPCRELFKSYISEVLKALDPKLVKELDEKKAISWLHIHTFRLHEEEKEGIIDYSWRLINLINARGVGAFTCILAIFIPVGYAIFQYIYAYVQKLPLPEMPGTETIILILLCYASIVVFTTVLLSGIPRIKKHLSDLNLEVIVSKGKDLEEFVLAYASVKIVCVVKDILSRTRHDEDANRSIEKAFTYLRDRQWKEALEKAAETYSKSKQN